LWKKNKKKHNQLRGGGLHGPTVLNNLSLPLSRLEQNRR
jgi:hypothetical protein